MTSNFFLNNLLTYRDMRLRGRALLWGWVTFVLACSVGALANVGIATYLYQADSSWVLSAVGWDPGGGRLELRRHRRLHLAQAQAGLKITQWRLASPGVVQALPTCPTRRDPR